MKDIQKFISGFRVFQKDYFGSDDTSFEPLKKGQNPKTMIIGCSDARVDPALLTNCSPGEIFIVRNVANLVPAFEQDEGHHGVSAALEYAICQLEVEYLIVLGHSNCGGINALMSGQYQTDNTSFIANWMSIAKPAHDQVLAELADKDPALQCQALEQASILLSVENLHTFPFIDERVKAGKLTIFAWYFDLEQGELMAYDAKQCAFHKVTSRNPPGSF